MGILDSLKRWLGYTSYKDNNNISQFNDFSPSDSNDKSWVEHPTATLPFNSQDTMSFNVFSNPIEIHRYFEHQMNELIRNFSGFGDATFPDFPFSQYDATDTEGLPYSNNSLRDQYLKHGYERNPASQPKKADSDIDGKLNVHDLDSVLKGKSSTEKETVRPDGFHFGGKSIVVRTIRGSDGVTETHTTVKDERGNETTTLTRKLGQKEHKIITKRDSSGHEEITEEFVNMNDHNANPFLANDPQKPLPNWFPFGKFF